MAGLSALETAPDLFSRVLERAGPALTAFEILPRIGVEFVLNHGSAVRDPFAAPYPWYVLFDLTSPREGDELPGLAESVLGAAPRGRRDRQRGRSRRRSPKARSCGACAS